MLFFAKNKLSALDKKITVALAGSDWYGNNCNRTIADGFSDIDNNESWVGLVLEFISIVWKENGYRKIIEPSGLNQQDLIKVYLSMIMATMPDPIIKTGSHPMAHSLIGSCIYQEENRQLTPFMNQIRLSEFDKNSDFMETSMKFAKLLQMDITAALGPAYLLDSASRLTGC